MSEFFYLSPEGIRGDVLVFPRLESRHILRSCRRRVGARIQATNGGGILFTVEITAAGDRVRGRVLEKRRIEPARPTIALAAGVGRRDRMSWLVEKGTEIGMAAFHPLVTAWSDVHRARTDWDAPLARWRRVAIAAIKQSGRCHLPEIYPPEPLEGFLRRAPIRGERRILLDRGPQSRPLGDLLGGEIRSVLVALGPEGGFTPEEAAGIADAGFERGRLLDRVLRFETAGVVAMALIAARTHGAHDER